MAYLVHIWGGFGVVGGAPPFFWGGCLRFRVLPRRQALGPWGHMPGTCSEIAFLPSQGHILRDRPIRASRGTLVEVYWKRQATPQPSRVLLDVEGDLRNGHKACK